MIWSRVPVSVLSATNCINNCMDAAVDIVWFIFPSFYVDLTSYFSTLGLCLQMFPTSRYILRFYISVLFHNLNFVLQIHAFCKMLSDFSLEYRTLYSKMLQRNEKRKRKTGVLIPTVSYNHKRIVLPNHKPLVRLQLLTSQ